MLAREYLRERADDYRQALKNRGAAVDLDRFLELDSERRRAISEVEQLKAKKNTASAEIATLKKNKHDATAQIAAMKSLGDEIAQLDARRGEIESELDQLALFLDRKSTRLNSSHK
jgi:seryl-tRNA synthetase